MRSQDWIKKANEDVLVAKHLINVSPANSAYHSQQAVEKYLKAFLIVNNVDPPKTHNIYYLLRLCTDIDNEFNYLKKLNTQKLTKYSYVRYPVDLEISSKDAREAIEIAEKVREFVLKKLEKEKNK